MNLLFKINFERKIELEREKVITTKTEVLSRDKSRKEYASILNENAYVAGKMLFDYSENIDKTIITKVLKTENGWERIASYTRLRKGE